MRAAACLPLGIPIEAVGCLANLLYACGQNPATNLR